MPELLGIVRLQQVQLFNSLVNNVLSPHCKVAIPKCNHSRFQGFSDYGHFVHGSNRIAMMRKDIIHQALSTNEHVPALRSNPAISRVAKQCGMGESNSRPQFGKLLLYHLTNPAIVLQNTMKKSPLQVSSYPNR